MDSVYDMNKTFSTEQSKSQIWTLLVSVGLQKYMENIMNGGVDFHAFCNLTRDDMRFLGIKNFQDQETLIELVRPMAVMYRELDNYSVNWNKIRSNLIQSLVMLTGSLSLMKRAMRKRPGYRSLVDFDTPSTHAIIVLIDLIQSRINLIDRDLREKRKKLGIIPKESRSEHPRAKILVSGVLLVLAASAVWRFRTSKSLPGWTLQVPGIRFLMNSAEAFIST